MFGAVTCVTNNSGACATYAANFSLTSSGGGSTLTLSYATGGSISGAIDAIYLDPVNAITFSTLTQSSASSGVNFSGTGNPANLPGANSINPTFASAINIFSTSNANRIDPGESITLAATGPSGAINIGTLFANNQLLVGLHVQSISGGNVSGNPSDALILTPTSSTVPEPSTFGAMGIGLIALGLFRRKRSRA
jgi:hypothetical protein